MVNIGTDILVTKLDMEFIQKVELKILSNQVNWANI